MVRKHIRLDPAMVFPPEIMSDIFTRTLPFKTFAPQRSSVIRSLCLVSKMWYSIGVECPQLWTSVTANFGKRTHIIQPSDEGEELSNSCLAARWFRRAGGLPLSLRILGVDSSNSHKLTVMLSHLSQDILHRIRFLYCYRSDLRAILKFTASVETLVLANSGQASIDSIELFTSGSPLSQLRKLHFYMDLGRWRLGADLLQKISHWRGLTHLTMLIGQLDTWLAIISTCENLICGVFTFTMDVTTGSTTGTVLPATNNKSMLSKTTSLTFLFWGEILIHLLRYIETPILTTLRLWARQNQWPTKSHFYDVQEQLSKVTKLSILLRYKDAEEARHVLGFTRMLPHVPMLEELDLDCESQNLSPLLIREVSAHPIPALRLLSVHVVHLREDEEENYNYADEELKALVMICPQLFPVLSTSEQGKPRGIHLYIPGVPPPPRFQEKAKEKYKGLPVKIIPLKRRIGGHDAYYTFHYPNRLTPERDFWYDGLYSW